MPEAPVLYVLNGPNLNLLGVREPDIYGRETLADVQALCEAAALVLNPAGYGHTSVALLDALKTLSVPIIECHLSNPVTRERFRHRSYVSPVAAGVVSGFGPFSYELAVKAALRLAQEHRAAAGRSV